VVQRRRRAVDPGSPRDTRLAIQYVAVTAIAPYPTNPRDNAAAVAAVKHSIDQFGFLVPMVLDNDNTIIAGHTRLAAAQELGMTEVPVIYARELSPSQIQAFRLIDNKSSELASWNTDLLAHEIAQLAESGIDLTQMGWSAEEIDCLSALTAEDCLSAVQVEADNPSAAVARRQPVDTRYVLGSFLFFTPSPVFNGWARAVREANDFDEQAIIRDLKARLGLVDFEDEED